MTIEESIIRLHTDPNFICIKRFDYSLEKLLERFPDGAPDKTIAAALMVEVEVVETIYQNILVKLRRGLGVDPSL